MKKSIGENNGGQRGNIMTALLKSFDVYSAAYSLIDEATPLRHKDCGALCDGACCKGDDETGMYLYPFEEAMFLKKDSCDCALR